MRILRYWPYFLVVALILSAGLYGANRAFSADDNKPSVGLVAPVHGSTEYAGDTFTVEKISQSGGGLEITLKPVLNNSEVPRSPALVVGSVRHRGDLKFKDGSLSVVFDKAPSSLDGAFLEIPSVSIERNVVTSQPGNAEFIVNPDGDKYQITQRVVDEENSKYIIFYEPDKPRAPYVTEAVMRVGDTQVYATSAGASLNLATGEFKVGRITFPLEASELVSLKDAILEITTFREVVRDRLELSPVQ